MREGDPCLKMAKERGAPRPDNCELKNSMGGEKNAVTLRYDCMGPGWVYLLPDGSSNF